MTQQHARFWLGKAQLLRTKLNFAIWLSEGLSVLLITSIAYLVASFPAVYLWGITRVALWYIYGGLVVFCLITAYFRTSKHFFSVSEVLSKLDAELRLNNRLTCAQVEVGLWPSPELYRPILSWKPQGLLTPLIISALALLLASMLEHQTVEQRNIQKPLNWQQMKEQLSILEQNNAVDDASLDEFKKQLAELGKRPPEDWYDHSSLEAGDSLKQRLDSSIDSLKNSLEELDTLLSDFESAKSALELPPKTQDAGKLALKQQMDQALEKLEQAPLGAPPSLEQQLRQSMDSGVTREELRSMQKHLQQNLHTLEEAQRRGNQLPGQQGNNSNQSNGAEQQQGQRNPQNQGGRGNNQPQAVPGQAETQGGQNGEQLRQPGQGSQSQDNKPGQGSISRGPGTAPLNHTNNPGIAVPRKIENASSHKLDQENSEYSRFIGIKPPPVEGNRNNSNPGSILPEGQGGRQVWKERYSAREQQLLEEYFSDE